MPNYMFSSPQEVKKKIEEQIGAIIKHRTGMAQHKSPQYYHLWKEIERVFHAGGKRLRPYLVVLAYEAFQKDKTLDTDDVFRVACAYELLHMAMLIHDDIIDRDITRHGAPTINGQYRLYYTSDEFRDIDVIHASNNAALLAGDAILSEAHFQLASTLSRIKNPEKVLTQFHDAIYTVIGGELLDTEVSDVPYDKVANVNVKAVAAQKTASYSFISPLVTGALLADASDEQIKQLTVFAQSIGIGFQYRDDMLGIFGDESSTGKSTYGDISEGKITLLTQLFFEKADDSQIKQFKAGFGVLNAESTVYDGVKRVMTEAGVPQEAEAVIQQKRQKATKALDTLNLSDDARKGFEFIIQKALNREK